MAQRRVLGSGNRVALVVKRGDRGEVGLDAEDCVESIGLTASLGRDSVECSLGFRASGLRSGISTADVHEVVAHELGDDVTVLSRVVLVRS